MLEEIKKQATNLNCTVVNVTHSKSDGWDYIRVQTASNPLVDFDVDCLQIALNGEKIEEIYFHDEFFRRCRHLSHTRKNCISHALKKLQNNQS